MGFWRALFGGRENPSSRSDNPSNARLSGASVKPKVLHAEAPIACDSGHENRIAVIGLMPGHTFNCSTCGSIGSIDQELFNEIERRFVSEIRSQIVATGARPPGEHAIRFLQANGRWATSEELRSDWKSATRVPNAPGVIEHETFLLGGASACQAAINACQSGQVLSIVLDESKPGQLVVTAADRRVGSITPRHPVAKAIAAGNAVLHASVNSLVKAGGGQGLRLRVVTGPEGATWVPWVTEPREYRVGLVGESKYQKAIRRCGEGDDVELLHEPDNPFDQLAIAAVSERGDTIGYIGRDSWLRDAIHDQGKGCAAKIRSINGGALGLLGVVIDVELCGGPIGKRRFEHAR